MKIVIAEYCCLGNSVLLFSTFKTLKYIKNCSAIYVGNNKFIGIINLKFNKYLDEIVYLSKFNIKTFFKLHYIIKYINCSRYQIIMIKIKFIFSGQLIKKNINNLF